MWLLLGDGSVRSHSLATTMTTTTMTLRVQVRVIAWWVVVAVQSKPHTAQHWCFLMERTEYIHAYLHRKSMGLFDEA